MTDTITVNRKALRQILKALTGPSHHIREIQATTNLPGDTTNPLNILVDEFNAQVEKENEDSNNDTENS